MAAHPADSQAGLHREGGIPSFPSGLRLLVVDDDPTCLMIVAGMLRKCNYEGADVSQAVSLCALQARAADSTCPVVIYIPPCFLPCNLPLEATISPVAPAT